MTPETVEQNQTAEGKANDEQNQGSQKILELLARQLATDELDEGHELDQAKDACKMVSTIMTRNYSSAKILPRADMWSLLLMGKNPTKGICMLASVPRAYHVV